MIKELGNNWPWPIVGDSYKAGESTWFETTQERSDDALGAVPPIYFKGGFFMGEPANHDSRGIPVYAGFVKVGDRHFVREIPQDQGPNAVHELHEALTQ